MNRTDISNLALGALGKDSIENFDTERSPQAQACRRWFDVARRQTLAQFDWNGARRRSTLSLHTDATPPEWAVRYKMPSGCVAFRKIQNPGGDLAPPIPFRQELSSNGEEKTILCNTGDAVGVYTWDQQNLDLLGEWFGMTMAHLMASMMAIGLTGKSELRNDNFNLWRNMLAVAEANDANQNRDEDQQAPWILAREQ